MTTRIALTGLHTAPGLHTRSQEELAARFRMQLEDVEGAERVRKTSTFVHEASGIDARHLEIAPQVLDSRSDWVRLVNDACFSMADRAITGSLERAGIAAGDVDALVVASSAYVGFPSLSRRLQEHLELPLHAVCYDLAGLGCAAPTHALHLASTLVAAGQARTVAVVCSDAMGTHGAARRFSGVPSMSEVVAHVLASDAAAAAIITASPAEDRGDPTLWFEPGALSCRLWPGSLDQNDLGAGADNQPYLSVGKAIRTRLLEELAEILDDDALREPFVMHPGGAALTEAVADAHPTLAPWARRAGSVLRAHGNVGAASLLFVLEQLLEDDRPHLGAPGTDAAITGTVRLFALGPGIVSTLWTLRQVSVEL